MCIHNDCKTNNDTFHDDTTALCSDKDQAGNPTFELLSLLSCISLISRISRWRDEEIEMEEMEMVAMVEMVAMEMVEMVEMTMFSLKVLIASLKGSWRQVGWYTSNRLEQYNFKLLSAIDQHHHHVYLRE